MSKKTKKESTEGIITVSVPFVKRRELKGGIKYEGRGVRTYKVPLQTFHDNIKMVLENCPFTDEITSESTSCSKEINIKLPWMTEDDFNKEVDSNNSSAPYIWMRKEDYDNECLFHDLIRSFFE